MERSLAMKKRQFKLAEIFGTFLAEGSRAAAFRVGNLEQSLAANEAVVLDFAGVRNINDSFANALIVPLIEIHGDGVLERLKFVNCNGIVRVMIDGALSLGMERSQTSRPGASL